MMRIATPRTMKNPQVFVGAGFKPALRRKIDLIRPGNALGGFETRPYETVLRSNVCDVFHANFHGVSRLTLTNHQPLYCAALVAAAGPSARQ